MQHPVRRATTWTPVAVLIAVLAVSNVVSNRVLPESLYIPWNLLVAAAVLAIALRLDGREPDELGLSRATLARGVRVGAIAVGLTTLTFLLAAALPATRDLFDDARAEGQSLPGILYNALVRVPLGTVVLEEVAFRGALPAVLLARVGLRPAVAVSAGLFGLWHVLPAANLREVNPAIEDVFGDASVVLVVVLAVLATAVAGFFLWWLRRWSGSLAAPALSHWSTNGLGYLLAYLVSD
ncbi:MAG: lysostaphin resistance A-like protein [Acidimicrobiales bacterium]